MKEEEREKYNKHRDMVKKIKVNKGIYHCLHCGNRATHLQARDPDFFELTCLAHYIFGIMFRLPIVDKQTMDELRLIQIR